MTTDNGFTPITLDASLDDIDDLPTFTVFPAGAYTVSIDSIGAKDIGEHPAVEVSFKLMEVMELTETLPEGEKEPQVGDVQSIAFMLDNQFGVGKMKEFMKPLAEVLGKTTINEIIAEAKGMTLVIVQKRRKDKVDPDKLYPELKKVAVV